MVEKFDFKKINRQIYFILILSLAASLPLSIFSVSFIEILLTLNWITEGNFKRKLKILKHNRSVLIFSSLYLLYIAGLIITSDFEYALHCLKIKLPLLLLPVIIGTSNPFTYKELKIIVLAFVGGAFISALFSSAIFFNIVRYEFSDIRQISIFISHIRLSLMVVFSVFILMHFIVNEEKREFSSTPWKFSYSVMCLCLIAFLFILKSFTGLVIFGICFLVVIWYYAGKIENVAPRFIIRVLLITGPLILMSYISRSVGRFYYRETIDFSSLEKYSVSGSIYYHDTISVEAENGNFVWIYLSEEELRENWNKMSALDYDGRDKRGQDIKYTLIRYLSSKGLRKDKAGLNQLTSEDIAAIENGLTNYLFKSRFSLYPRIYEIIWEIDRFKKGKEPGDHSVSQRLLYGKAAFSIFLANPVFGTGTGDIKNELNNYYRKNYPLMPEKLRKYPHNQYLTILMTFGIAGLMFFLSAILLPVFIRKRWKNFMIRIFLFIMFLSMLSDDTLETQTGVSLFAFFYSLLIFGIEERKDS